MVHRGRSIGQQGRGAYLEGALNVVVAVEGDLHRLDFPFVGPDQVDHVRKCRCIGGNIDAARFQLLRPGEYFFDRLPVLGQQWFATEKRQAEAAEGGNRPPRERAPAAAE